MTGGKGREEGGTYEGEVAGRYCRGINANLREELIDRERQRGKGELVAGGEDDACVAVGPGVSEWEGGSVGSGNR